METDDWGIPVIEKPVAKGVRKKVVDDSLSPDELWESVDAIDVKMSKLEDVVKDRVGVSVESSRSGTVSFSVTVEAGDLSRIVRSLDGTADVDASLAQVFGDEWCKEVESVMHKEMSEAFGGLVSDVAVECRQRPISAEDFQNAFFDIRVAITFGPQSIQSGIKSLIKEVVGKLI